MQTQRQLLAISFLCGFVNEDLWTTLQEPKQPFLQGIKSMAEAATRAAVAAERALERATSALQVVVFMMAFSRVVQKLHLISFRKSLLTVGI